MYEVNFGKKPVPGFSLIFNRSLVVGEAAEGLRRSSTGKVRRVTSRKKVLTRYDLSPYELWVMAPIIAIATVAFAATASRGNSIPAFHPSAAFREEYIRDSWRCARRPSLVAIGASSDGRDSGDGGGGAPDRDESSFFASLRARKEELINEAGEIRER